MPAIADDPNGLINACETGPRVATGVRAEISLLAQVCSRLKPVFYWLFSVAGASFGLETFEPGGPNVSLDLAREPLNPRLFVPAP